MPAFSFTAVDNAGLRHAGVRDAASVEALGDALRREGFFVLGVNESDAATVAKRFSSRRDHAALLDFTRAMATLLPAGLPLSQALDAASRMSPESLRGVLGDVRTRVERGERLASALAEHVGAIPSHYIGLVRAGERSGALAGAFERLAVQLEREAELRARLFSAALYPSVLAVAGGAAMLVLVLVVLPQFAALLSDAGAELPASTRTVLAISSTLRTYWMLLPMLAAAIALIVVRARRNVAVRLGVARVLARLPIIGALRRESSAARFARLTGTLVQGGAPLLGALDDTAAAIDSPLARGAIERVRDRVRSGGALHEALAHEPTFPPLLTQLTALGEESARLGEFLLKAAELFEERTGRTVQRMVALAEPAMIVMFGGAIGFVALSLLQAIYSVNAGGFR
jgi:general secretion pathway protein F